jgi:hypothetical protein
VKHDNQRDASIDTFLRKSLRRDPAPAPDGPCVEPEVIAAWAEGALSRNEAAAIEAHLANCAACQQVLAVFARTVPAPVESGLGRTRWHLRWAIPMTAAATAVAIWVAVPDDRKEPIQDAFAIADSTPSTEPSEPAAKSEADRAAPSVVAPERSESPARRDADSSLRARAENREMQQEKQEAGGQALPREPAAPAAAAAPTSDPRPLADAAEAPAAARSAAVAQQRPEAEAFAPIEVVSPDPNVRWRVLTTGRLERSINAGKTWETVPLQMKIADVRAVSATTAIATAVDGRQFRTDNQGRTWNPVQP